jgi:hypothetical protein
MDEGRWPEALAALERAADFADVSSDISWLLALARSRLGKPRGAVLEALRQAVAVNQWRRYKREDALVMEAELLIVLGFHREALSLLSALPENAGTSRLSLLALRNSGNDETFLGDMERSLNRYPRDAEIAKIYLEYLGNKYRYREDLRNRNPGKKEMELFNLILKRLTFLLEADRELAWMAAPFAANREDAARLIAAYRASGKAAAASLPISLQLGVVDEAMAIEEFFAKPEAGDLSLERILITGIWDELRTGESRGLFRRNLSGFSGVITEDTNRDGTNEYSVNYREGRILGCFFDVNQDGFMESAVYFEAGEPGRAEWAAAAESSPAYWPPAEEAVQRISIRWEQYPAVLETEQAGVRYIQRPGAFLFAPFRFIELPGGVPVPGNGLLYPERESAAAITRRALVSSALRLERQSREFPGAVETVELEGSIPVRAAEYLEGRAVSITHFFRGRPVFQQVDLNLDGRMETMRFFRRPPPEEDPASLDPLELLDYSFDFERAESDWDGDGIFEEKVGPEIVNE